MIPHITVIKAGTGVLTKTSDGTLDRAALVRTQRDVAVLKEMAGLPDDYIDYGADRFLDEEESATGAVGYAARIESGLRFPTAATNGPDGVAPAVANPADSNVKLISGITLPDYTQITEAVVIGNVGELALNSFQFETLAMTVAEMGRVRIRLGEGFTVSESDAWWGTGKYIDPQKRIFAKNGETFQVIALNELDPTGVKLYRVRRRWVDTTDQAYWTRPVGSTTNFAGYHWVQTFLNAKGRIVDGLGPLFSRLDASGDVTLQILECKADSSPDKDRVIASVTVPYASLKVGEAFYSIAPTYLEAGKYYGLAIITSANHWVYVNDTGTPTQGNLFFRNGSAYYQSDPTKNILLNLRYAKFRRPRTEILLQPVSLAGGITNIDFLALAAIGEGTDVVLQVQDGTGVYRDFDPNNPSPLAQTPALANLKMVFTGTLDLQPMIRLGDSRIIVSRPALVMKHIADKRTLAAPAENVTMTVRLENFDEDDHDCTLRLKVGSSEVAPAGVVDVEVTPGVIDRTGSWALGAPTSAYTPIINGAAASVNDLFTVSKREDVAIS